MDFLPLEWVAFLFLVFVSFFFEFIFFFTFVFVFSSSSFSPGNSFGRHLQPGVVLSKPEGGARASTVFR